jgi:phosphate transport system protein
MSDVNPKTLLLVEDDPDLLEVDLEEEALKILALHAPVATDLRYLVAVIKINNDLERIDLMAQCTRTMVRDAIRSLVHRDPQLARKVLAEDDTVDDLQTEILGVLEGAMHNRPEAIPALMRWSSVVRNVERIADNATNIAEDVIYMEEGVIVRHRQPGFAGAETSDG